MTTKRNGPSTSRNGNDQIGAGGELHQHTTGSPLTTSQGVPIGDDQNSLRIGARGPTLLEDFHFLEKITHFDHERIPERVVHARGSGAHGYFQPYKSFAKYTRADFLQDPSIRTPVFTRFSTVAGGAGSVDTPRDVRGFAVKFYTREGNFDLVGNNIPVFFIQDAIKFPDLIHSVKMEPDRGFPQNATAHDTFWDFISLMPESIHMAMWIMSDRTIPRSLRMMEGFGVHTFRLVDAKGKATFIKWHWRPTLGTQSMTWDEAVKICGADQDYHRRDLFEAIHAGNFPAWELSIQAIAEGDEASFDFDVLDPTKLLPEEDYPLIPVGKMVLDRWPDNFFAETEQVAMHPGHLVPGIEFSDDPLLQGRIFSYTDTQLKRLGGPNFHELEINRPKCPMHNFQRDGMARAQVDKGRTSYEPNSLERNGSRETPAGFVTHPSWVQGNKVRERSATFDDHYSQARMFFRSMNGVEQDHIVSAFTFELSKVQSISVRTRMLGHLDIVDAELGDRVAAGLGMEGRADTIRPAHDPKELAPSPALSILDNAKATLNGRVVGALLDDDFDNALLDKLRVAINAEGATLQIVAPRIGGATAKNGSKVSADHIIMGGPSAIFDVVVVMPGETAVASLAHNAAAVAWVGDAFHHCKVIGVVAGVQPLLDRAGVIVDDGIVDLGDSSDGDSNIAAFVAAAKHGRIWKREASGEGTLANAKPPTKPSGKGRPTHHA